MRFCFVLSVLLLSVACSPTTSTDKMSSGDASKVVRYWVNSAKVDCEGVGQQTCYQIQRGDTLRRDGWENFYGEIEGFEFEPGNIFHLRVEEKKLDSAEVPADGSSMMYTMVEFISRTPDIRLKLHNIYALEAIEGERINVPSDLEQPNLEVNVTEGRIMGTDGCNSFQASANVSLGGELILGPISSTEKMCKSSKLPQDYMNAMAEVNHYGLRNGKLFLSNAEGTVLLRFRPVD